MVYMIILLRIKFWKIKQSLSLSSCVLVYGFGNTTLSVHFSKNVNVQLKLFRIQ